MTEKTKLRLAAVGALLLGPLALVLFLLLFLIVGVYEIIHVLVTGKGSDDS